MDLLEGSVGKEGTQSFRDLVGPLLKDSPMFPPKEMPNGESLGILDAIENGELSHYVPEGVNDPRADVIDTITGIYRELKKDYPAGDYIDDAIDRLQTYLQP